jgi:putative ABC transport system substrate-binding protein
VNDRRSLLALALATLAPHAHGARNRMPIVGFLGPPDGPDALARSFFEGLESLGYVEGRTVHIERRRTDAALQGGATGMTALATELVALRPAVLVGSIVEAVIALQAATRSIPIVMVSVADPVAAGIVGSLARPGGNVTGLSRQSPDLVGKLYQLLRELLPGMRRVGVLMNPDDPTGPTVRRLVERAARDLGFEALFLLSHAPAGLDDAFARLAANRVAAVHVGGGGAYFLNRAHIVELANAHRLPSIFVNREFVDAGGLLSYAPSNVEIYRRAAKYVDKILRGVRPSDLPIEQPTIFELVLNVRTAAALGIDVPPSILLRANDVIR